MGAFVTGMVERPGLCVLAKKGKGQELRMNYRSMIEQSKENIERVIGRIREIGGDRIAFIALYGSVAKNRDTHLSDIDLAVFYEGSKEERFKFRMSVLGRTGDEFDVQIFQDLPLYIQKEVITYGKLLYYGEYDVVFDIYINTIKNFDDFTRHLNLYYSYSGGVSSGCRK